MILFTQIVFWTSILALLHTYVIYPVSVILFSKRKKDNCIVFTNIDELPRISIIMAVHNEERVIGEKIESIVQNNYPINKLTVYIGSDASTDNTDNIIKDFLDCYPYIKFKRYDNRLGKINIINDLSSMAQADIFIYTDANAILNRNALFELVKHFRNQEIKVVGGRLLNRKTSREGIAIQEHFFMESEFKIKLAEGRLWGCTIGAYGAFFAVRKDCFHAVPENFIVDDFYISIKAIEKSGKAICEPKAIACEDVPGEIKSEFNRKSRIASGNFQNLFAFFHLYFSSRFALMFCFTSHKVLRWFGPIFLILIFISLSLLYKVNIFYTTLFVISILSLLVPFIDFFHRIFKIHIVLLRYITHFYYMNAALLKGLFNFIKGVKTNVWEPTKRH